MSQLEVRTNWNKRELMMVADLPEKAQADFDYIEGDDRFQSRIVKFKDNYYDVFDTQSIQVGTHPTRLGWAMSVLPDHPFAKWDAIINESYFSGVLFKINTDDTVTVGQYFS